MKNLFLSIILFSIGGVGFSQEWFSFDSINQTNIYNLQSLSCDPATNTILVNQLNQIGVLKGSGERFALGFLSNADYLFQHSPAISNAYFHNDGVYAICLNYGLRKMTFSPTFKDTILYNEDVVNCLIDHDTIWVSGDDVSDATKIVNDTQHYPFTMGAYQLIKYKGQVFGAGIGIYYHNGTEFIQFNEGNSNLLSNYSFKFTKNYDEGILFVGTKEGISQFNGIDFTNITPLSHSGMPYKTVIDIEYDKRHGKLWMVLGDTNWNAKTLTSYDGTWETFDQSNSPINFNEFRDMTIDTLGQVWFGEEGEVHVLNTNQLEGWLATEKHKKQRFDVSVYPNPSNGIINLKIAADEMVQLRIFNSKGQEVYHQDKASGIIELDLPEGIYHYTVTNDTQEISTGKFIRL